MLWRPLGARHCAGSWHTVMIGVLCLPLGRHWWVGDCGQKPLSQWPGIQQRLPGQGHMETSVLTLMGFLLLPLSLFLTALHMPLSPCFGLLCVGSASPSPSFGECLCTLQGPTPRVTAAPSRNQSLTHFMHYSSGCSFMHSANKLNSCVHTSFVVCKQVC